MSITDASNDLNLDPGQDLVLRDLDGRERVRVDAATGTIRVRSEQGDIVLRIDAGGGSVWLGGFGRDGDVLVFARTADVHTADAATIHLDGDAATARVGRESRSGRVRIGGPDPVLDVVGDAGRVLVQDGIVLLQDASGRSRIGLSGRTADASFGGEGEDGEVAIRDANGERTIFLNGATANAAFGTVGNAGAIFVKDDDGANAIVLNGATGNAAFGTADNAGAIFVKEGSGADAIVINGATGNVALGRDGNGGELLVKDDQGRDAIVLRGTTGNIGVGRAGGAGNVFVKNDAGDNTIHLSGQTGDILLRNGDCAEAFDVEEAEAEPGDVMVIGDGDVLRRCCQPYDRRVAGILSGAGACRPGIILGEQASERQRQPLALVGKVYCKVDASYGAVEVGDLVTSSATAGHAMRVGDPALAFGAVIGKSLGRLAAGRGQVPVLVGLQ